MRILLLSDRIPPENRGGAGEVAWRLAHGLQASGHEVHVAAATEQASFQEQREGIPTTHIHARYPERWHAWLSLYNPQTVGALGRLLDALRPDLLNAHNIHRDLSYAALGLARQRGIATIFSAHDVMPFAYGKIDYFIPALRQGASLPAGYRLPPWHNLRLMRFRYNPLRNWLIRRWLTRNALLRTAPSAALADALAANDLPSFEVVPNGLDAERFQVAPEQVEALRARLKLEERRVLLIAGRLTRAKGMIQLLQALEVLVQRVPDAVLLVLSAQPVDSMIRDARFQTLAQRHICSGGWLSGAELAAAYHLADLVVTPSIVFDTFPTVNLEAMAARKPVIATIYGGSREVVQDGVTGWLVDPFHIEELAAKIERLLTDEPLRRAMGEAGYQRLQATFTLKHQVARMLDVYQRAIHLG